MVTTAATLALQRPLSVVVAEQEASRVGDPDVIDRCHAELVALAARRGDALPVWLAAWGVCAGKVLERANGTILVWCTGTFVAGAGCPTSSAYRARADVAEALGVTFEIRGGSSHLRMAPEARIAAATFVRDLHLRGVFPELPPDILAYQDRAESTDHDRFWMPLDGATPNTRGRFKCRCPVHDDNSPSLSGAMNPTDGSGWARCHAAGCGAVLAVRQGSTGLEASVRKTNVHDGSRTRGSALEAVGTKKGPPARARAASVGGVAPGRVGRPVRVVQRLQPRGPRFSTAGSSLASHTGSRRRGSRAYAKAYSTQEQRYESVGWKCATPQDWRETASGRRFPAGFGAYGGTDRVVIDVDGLDPGSDPDGWDPGLPAARDALLEFAADDDMLAGVEVVATGPDGVQVRLLLASPVADEVDFYSDPDTRSWLAWWGDRVRILLNRGGTVDDSVWRPGGYLRAPGWRWSRRCRCMFLARLVNEEAPMGMSRKRFEEESRRLRAEWEAQGHRPEAVDAHVREHSAGIAHGVNVPPPVVFQNRTPKPPPEAPRPPMNPHPAAVVESIVLKLGGNPWSVGGVKRFRVYFGDAWVEARPPTWNAKKKAWASRGLMFSSHDFWTERRVEKVKKTVKAGVKTAPDIPSGEVDRIATQIASDLNVKAVGPLERRIGLNGSWISVAPNGFVTVGWNVGTPMIQRAIRVSRRLRSKKESQDS